MLVEKEDICEQLVWIDDGKWNDQLSLYVFTIYDDVKTGLWYDYNEWFNKEYSKNRWEHVENCFDNSRLKKGRIYII